MGQKTIAIIGATGSQGKGVVDALIDQGTFKVRAITRNPEKYSGKADEVVKGDLDDLNSLKNAFKNTHGVFVVTNFWEGADETAQGRNAIEAAKAVGVNHFIWSTLPNVEVISEGKFEVPHFTLKARVDDFVRTAGFNYSTFVQAPFYFQNFSGMFGPQPQQDGSTGWALPLDPSLKVIHMSDINDLGKVVTGAFSQPEKIGDSSYLSLSTELNSFNDIIKAFQDIGKTYTFSQVPAEIFSTAFEGAKELAEMLGYFEEYTYMGPDNNKQIDLAKKLATGKLTSFRQWISENA